MGINADTVRRMFSHLESGSGDRFFGHVADDVDWTVEGTHPLAGRYLSKDDFQAHPRATKQDPLWRYPAPCPEHAN